MMTLGTSIHCSGSWRSKGERTSTSCSTICGSTSWSSGITGTGSTICSTVRPDASEAVKPRPPRSSSYSDKNSVSPATLVFWLRRAMFVASAVAVFCLRRAEWCVATATAWAIDCCSCRQAARCRRPLCRWAAPVLGCQLGSIRKGDATKVGTPESNGCCCCCLGHSSMCCFGRGFG